METRYLIKLPKRVKCRCGCGRVSEFVTKDHKLLYVTSPKRGLYGEDCCVNADSYSCILGEQEIVRADWDYSDAEKIARRNRNSPYQVSENWYD